MLYNVSCFNFSLLTLFSFSFQNVILEALPELSNGLKPDHYPNSIIPNCLLSLSAYDKATAINEIAQ